MTALRLIALLVAIAVVGASVAPACAAAGPSVSKTGALKAKAATVKKK